jgi:hypothetical protein
MVFKSLLSEMKFVVEAVIISGGVSGLLDVSC